MTPAAMLSATAAVISAFLAAATFGVGAAPGWREFRSFSLIAATASLYTAADVMVATKLPDPWVVWGSRVSLSAGGLHCFAWIGYLRAQEQRGLRGLERVAGVVAVLFAVLAPVPGLLVSDQVLHHRGPWGIVYNDAQPTALGGACFAAFCLMLAVPLERYVRGMRRGVPGAGTHALAVAVMLVAATNDALAGAAVARTPYLLSAAFLIVVGLIALVLVHRLLLNARALADLSVSLERQVGERTAELAAAQQALMRTEKLAALGRLAGGVAHEINNPTSVLVANLEYLGDCVTPDGRLPDDGLQCLAEALRATERIVGVTRQLLEAGGEDRSGGRCTCPVLPALAASVAAARASLLPGIAVRLEAPEGLTASASTSLVERVVGALVLNAGQAIASVRTAGLIQVRARATDRGVVVTVRDDGPGIAPSSLPHLFEPFFSSGWSSEAKGLGLSVVQGLLRAVGGEVRVEATSNAGTEMAILLPPIETAPPSA